MNTNKKPDLKPAQIKNNLDVYKFQKGNKLHLLRKHKGNKIKLTPEELLKSAKNYFDIIDDNPIKEAAIHQRTGNIIFLPKPRPYTLEGLCNHIGITMQTLYNYETMYKNVNTNDKEKKEIAAAFFEIITRIRQIIYQQKLEGAAANIFNSNIIARELGLTDKQEIKEEAKTININVRPSNTASQPDGQPSNNQLKHPDKKQ